MNVALNDSLITSIEIIFKLSEDRILLRAGQDLDEVGHPAYHLPTPRQYLSSEHKSDSSTLNYLLFYLELSTAIILP